MFNETPVYTSLAQALTSIAGNDASISGTERVSGGDINKSYSLTLSSGRKIFMKANEKDNAPFFAAEALGISAIASTSTVSTPAILCTGTEKGEQVGYSFLFMDFIESAAPATNYWEIFAEELASMHKASVKDFSNKKFGFIQNNFIGSRKQINTPSDSWIEFFRDRRLVPQFKDADHYFDDGLKNKITKLLDHLDEFLIEPESPSLLHGDLWAGNVMCGPDGKACLIDPAVYSGHAEADIAMTELFGGFPAEFYETYKSVSPLQNGYEERRDIYNLYHLLNHLNMFGANYLNPVRSIVSEYTD